MIFVFAEDGTLDIAADLAAVRVMCEPIDVESSVFQFYDADGRPLAPRFTKPNRQRKIIGMVWSLLTPPGSGSIPASSRRMSMSRTVTRCTIAVALPASLLLSGGQASAQSRDSLLNGAAIGGAIGAGVGIAFTHAVRDSDLTASQYAYGGLVFGALGAGIGLGVDALLSRSPRPFTVRRQRVLFAPAVGRVNGIAIAWRW